MANLLQTFIVEIAAVAAVGKGQLLPRHWSSATQGARATPTQRHVFALVICQIVIKLDDEFTLFLLQNMIFV